MLELGQPLHAFDAATLQGDIVVRRARAGEKLTTLDGVERDLDPEDVVICDDSGVISLAGIMGGATTEVGDATTDILLEAATWDPLAVFRGNRRHKLSSEAGKRFERTVDPAVARAALDRAAALLVEIAGGTVEPTLTDIVVPTEPVSIRMDIDLPDRIAGVTYPNGTAARRLTQIGCAVEVGVGEDGHGQLVVTPPSWRPDLRQPADLVEEVLRLEGLEQIPSVLPAAPAGRGLTPSQKRRRAVGKALAYDGYVEVLAPVFLPTGVFDTWGLDADDPRRVTTKVLNPLESDRPELATTLLPGLLEVLARNVSRGQRDLALFSIAQVVQPGPDTVAVAPLPVDRRPSDDEIATLEQSLPAQPVHVGGALAGMREPAGPWGPGRAAEASDAFAAAETIARAAGVQLERRAAQYLPWHPGRCAELLVDGVVVGHAGELHPAVVERAGLPPRTCAFELDLDALPIVRVAARSAWSRRSRRCCRMSRWWSTRRCRRRRSRPRCARVAANCSKTSGCSTCSKARRWARTASRSRSRCVSGRPIARSPRTRRALPVTLRSLRLLPRWVPRCVADVVLGGGAPGHRLGAPALGPSDVTWMYE